MLKPILVAAAALSLCVPASVAAQTPEQVRAKLVVTDSTRMQVLTLRDGSTLVGRILSVGQESVQFETSVGRMTIPIANIREVSQTETARMRDGEYWFPNPNATRLFFSSTGMMLKRGEGYISDYMLFFPGVAYGVTDNVTIGGGVSLFPVGLEHQVYYLTPKVGGSVSENVHLATGALIASWEGETVGIGYGVGTFGTPDASLTTGVGYGFSGSELSDKPIFLVGGEKRIARRLALVTENYIIPDLDENPVYSFGIRLMGEKLTVDLGLFNARGSGAGIGLPWVDFVFKF